MPGKSTMEVIYLLRGLMDKYRKGKKSAYDSTNLEKLTIRCIGRLCMVFFFFCGFGWGGGG